MQELRGTGVALVTPFNEDLSIDYNGLTKLVEYCISGGVNYLVALGTTAESATLSSEEKQAV
ncbi:dihydrodipicolinate synthase family protein, partial [uncultured Dokdonia sp.]